MSEKIMIIDDDESFLEELKDALASSGYDVDIVSDPMTAVAKVEKTKPDVILLDLKMAKETGFEIACRLRDDKIVSHIPIIAMSGAYFLSENSFLMRFCAFKRWLKKPFSPADAIRQIEAVLDEKKREFAA